MFGAHRLLAASTRESGHWSELVPYHVPGYTLQLPLVVSDMRSSRAIPGCFDAAHLEVFHIFTGSY
jgi:hypothetical protein